MNKIKATEYSLAAEGEKQLGEFFKVREFACHDGSDKILVHPELVKVLTEIRKFFGVPVAIESGYRSPKHNRAVGGVKDSQHLLGTAADIKVKGKTPKEVHRAITSGALNLMVDKMGIGLYPTFVHVDVRGTEARW